MDNKKILAEAKSMAPQLVEWRRALHQIPEIGMNLPKTSAYVQEQLTKMGIPFEVLCNGACVVVVLGDTTKGKCILLRGDMDALPMAEESGEEFASTNGCMHACGHDFHATTMLGVAKLLKEHEKDFADKGCVKLLFQPAEETFEGAKAAVADGIMENPHVDTAFALHVGSTVPVGVFASGAELMMASVYGFKITLTGLGAHGSSPEAGIDPIIPGAHLVLALEELLSREVAAADEVSLTVCKFASGSAANIIPNSAELQGTMRTFKPEVEERLIARIAEITEGIAKTFRVKAEITELSHIPSFLNNLELCDNLEAVLKSIDEKIVFMRGLHAMGSEDYAVISRTVPTTFAMVGAAVPEKDKIYGGHHPKVRFNEDCLPLGVAADVAYAIDWLNNK